MLTGYDSPSSVACRKPVCLEPLGTSKILSFKMLWSRNVASMDLLYSYPFVIMRFGECSPLLWSVQDVDHRLYLSCIFIRAYLPEKDMRNDLCDLVSGWRESDLMYFGPLLSRNLWTCWNLCSQAPDPQCLQGWWGWRILLISQKIVIRVVTLLPGRELSLN